MVGGDGSVLGAARTLVDLQVPVLGVNRGHLGLLTDVSPADLEDALNKGLNIKGVYIVDIKDCQIGDGWVTGDRIGKAYK